MEHPFTNFYQVFAELWAKDSMEVILLVDNQNEEDKILASSENLALEFSVPAGEEDQYISFYIQNDFTIRPLYCSDVEIG